MYNIKVNGSYSFKIQTEGDDLKVDGEPVQLDSKVVSSSYTHVLYKNKSYNIEIISENRQAKTMMIKVNGNHYEIALEDQYDQLLKKLGLDNLTSNKVKEVKAPMPGLVLEVIAKEGEDIKKGDNLLILEAMKMENILKSPTEGIISRIFVSKGNKVEKNQVLIQFT